MSTVAAADHRHDIFDRAGPILEPKLPGGPGKVGRPAQNNRRFINAVCWVLRTGTSWRDLPVDYGDWSNTHRRSIRGRNENVWAELQAALVDDPDFEWLMIDASYIKVHQHGAGARGGNQAVGRTKGSWTRNCIRRWTPTGCRCAWW